MTAPVRLSIFAAGLLVAFVAAWGVGGAFGPILDEPVPAHETSTHDGPDDH